MNNEDKNKMVIVVVLCILITISLLSVLFYFDVALGKNRIVGQAVMNFDTEPITNKTNYNASNNSNQKSLADYSGLLKKSSTNKSK